MKLEITVTEAKEIFKSLHEQNPEPFFEMIRSEIQQAVTAYLGAVMRTELTEWLGREPYVRGHGEVNHRNGFYPRRFAIKGIGDVRLLVPRDRRGDFQTRVLPRYRRYEQEIGRDLSLLFLCGISTRSLSAISLRLLGRRISPAEVSEANRELVEAVEQWRMRDLSSEAIQYLFIDGVNFRMRIQRRVESVPVLVAIGVTETGRKLVVGLQAGDKESATSWREFFRDLKQRGLDGSRVTLGIMDGLPSLETVFREEFPKARTQRCQVHVARNVLAKVPRRLKTEVAADIKPVFYAPSRPQALEAFERFRETWQQVVPSAVGSLERSLEACLTYLDFPAEQWVSLRTTNLIERLHKEFRRRTRPMEVLPGEAACYRLLAFISLKMELHWRSTPVGKVLRRLPFFNEPAHRKFTQES
ncbi:MAG TPA: IS256 family transposase [Syntrophales bacterium]|nr:IS256 family transposase [Syntrophales bacterium]